MSQVFQDSNLWCSGCKMLRVKTSHWGGFKGLDMTTSAYPVMEITPWKINMLNTKSWRFVHQQGFVHVKWLFWRISEPSTVPLLVLYFVFLTKFEGVWAYSGPTTRSSCRGNDIKTVYSADVQKLPFEYILKQIHLVTFFLLRLSCWISRIESFFICTSWCFSLQSNGKALHGVPNSYCCGWSSYLWGFENKCVNRKPPTGPPWKSPSRLFVEWSSWQDRCFDKGL